MSSGFIIQLCDIHLHVHEVTSVIAVIIPAAISVTFKQLPIFYLHPDPEQPFLRREANKEDLKTILIPHLSTDVTVPCLVTVPDLNVTLVAVCTHHRCLAGYSCKVETIKVYFRIFN